MEFISSDKSTFMNQFGMDHGQANNENLICSKEAQWENHTGDAEQKQVCGSCHRYTRQLDREQRCIRTNALYQFGQVCQYECHTL
jgi:hypothetical protein